MCYYYHVLLWDGYKYLPVKDKKLKEEVRK